MKIAFLDTNIIVRYIAGDDADKMEACLNLLKAADKQEIILETTQTIIAEVVYVLRSKKLYGLTAEEVKKRLMPILSIRGLKIEHRGESIRALDLMCTYDFDFEDGLSVAYMERQKLEEIYSYDRDFDRVEQLRRIEP